MQRLWELYSEPYRKFGTLSGRATRPEYWTFTLVNALLASVTNGVDTALGWYSNDSGLGVLTVLLSLALLIPSIALTVRRLHDCNLRGGWYFVVMVPFFGPLWLFLQMLIPGTHGENRFGPDPKGDLVVNPPADGGAPFARSVGRFSACPWCGKSNPQGLDSCQWCHRPYREARGLPV